MSVVGPRPGLPERGGALQPWHRQRLGVNHGIRASRQVSGRSDLTFDEMCLLDIYYIENWWFSRSIFKSCSARFRVCCSAAEPIQHC